MTVQIFTASAAARLFTEDASTAGRQTFGSAPNIKALYEACGVGWRDRTA